MGYRKVGWLEQICYVFEYLIRERWNWILHGNAEYKEEK